MWQGPELFWDKRLTDLKKQPATFSKGKHNILNVQVIDRIYLILMLFSRTKRKAFSLTK